MNSKENQIGTLNILTEHYFILCPISGLVGMIQNTVTVCTASKYELTLTLLVSTYLELSIAVLVRMGHI